MHLRYKNQNFPNTLIEQLLKTYLSFLLNNKSIPGCHWLIYQCFLIVDLLLFFKDLI